jgi:DNA-binding XRE family transcriptional regulator
MRHKSGWTEIRNQLGISQPQLAQFLGITRTTMSMIEIGEREFKDTPRLSYLRVFLANIPKEISAANQIGFTDKERKELEFKKGRLEVKLILAKADYESRLKQANKAAHFKAILEAMDFSHMGKDIKPMDLWKSSILSHHQTTLYRHCKFSLLELEIKIKSMEAKLACITSALLN